jgi:serine/threonine protein kinase
MVKKLPHDYRVDIWSLGVLLFECLAGYPPFTGKTEEDLFKNIRQLKIHWPIDFPPLAKNLVMKILKLNPKERPSLDEILKHSWFSHNPPIKPALVNKLTNERKILESHLISVKPSDKEVKEKLDLLFPNLDSQSQKEDEKNNEVEDNNSELKRKKTIMKIKNRYNNLNQSFYFSDTVAQAETENEVEDSKFVSSETVKKEMKKKELKEEHEKEKELLNRELRNLNKRIKDLENEKNMYKTENMKLNEEISLNENKVKDIIEKEKIIEKERKELFDEIEQKNNSLLDMKSKYNEANTEKERLLKENSEKDKKINELTKLLEIKNKNINENEKMIIKLQNEKNDINNIYQKKLIEIQNNIMASSSSNRGENNDSQKISSILILYALNKKSCTLFNISHPITKLISI